MPSPPFNVKENKMPAVKRNQDTLFKCSIVAEDGQVSHKCEILKIHKGISILIRFKKPRSSKFARKNIPWDKIIAYSKNDKEPKEGFISYIAKRVAIMRPFKGSVDVEETTGMHIVTSEEGPVYHVNPLFLEAMADESDEEPEEKTKPKKK